MSRIVWSERALDELGAIRAYIAQDSEQYADLTLRRVVAAVERLASFPQSGRTVPELRRPAIREVIVGPYRVVYRTRSEVVEIVTVFRGSRLFPEDV